MRKILFGLMATCLLAACGESENYAMPAKEVRSDLLQLRPPGFLFGSVGVDTMVSQAGKDQIRWTVIQDGKALLSFIATVTESGENSTEVAVTVEPAPGKADTQIGRGMAENPAVVKLYRKAMAEQIDARLENRPFDFSQIQGQMMAAAIATIPQMQKSMDEAAKHFDAMDRERDAAVAEADYERETRASLEGEAPSGETAE